MEKFTCVGPFFTFYEEIRKLSFGGGGSWDCHNRMRKEKLEEYSLVVTKYSLMMPADWLSTPRSPSSSPPTHTRAFQVPKSRCLLFRSQKSKWRGGGRRLQPCLPRSVFFFLLCPGILPGLACDRATERERCRLRRSCASAPSRRRRRGSVVAQIHAATGQVD
jgi:hypothetical protein